MAKMAENKKQETGVSKVDWVKQFIPPMEDDEVLIAIRIRQAVNSTTGKSFTAFKAWSSDGKTMYDCKFRDDVAVKPTGDGFIKVKTTDINTRKPKDVMPGVRQTTLPTLWVNEVIAFYDLAEMEEKRTEGDDVAREDELKGIFG